MGEAKGRPDFGGINLCVSDWLFTEKIMSSDAFAAQIVTNIKRRVPTSAIRMSDGELGVIRHYQTGEMAYFLKDPAWLKRYGLEDADLSQVGADLLAAGEDASYLSCTISGTFLPQFRVHPLFPRRERFIDAFYPKLWMATGRVGPVLRAGSVLVLHHAPDTIVPKLSERHSLTGVCGMTLSSWKDQDELLERVAKHDATTVLVSGGPSGKPFCVRLAMRTGKVVLDVGEALGTTWI